MDPKILRRQIEAKQAEVKNLQAQLDGMVCTCRHDWSEVQYDPEIIKGYTIRADGDNWHGADKILRDYVEPDKTKKRWKRICKKCGHTQYTHNTKSQTVSGPVPGTTAKADLPHFNDFC